MGECDLGLILIFFIRGVVWFLFYVFYYLFIIVKGRINYDFRDILLLNGNLIFCFCWGSGIYGYCLKLNDIGYVFFMLLGIMSYVIFLENFVFRYKFYSLNVNL